MKSLSLVKPHLIVMVGIPGSGKSFFADHFADTFNAPLVSSGRIRHELFNEPAYDSNEQAIIRRMSNYMLDELYKTHRTIVYEGTADTRTDRQAITKRSQSADYETLFVWVQTESTTARKRVEKAIKGNATIRSDSFDIALKHFSAPHHSEKAVVISGKHTYASQLKIVLKRLVEPRVELIDKQAPPARTIQKRTIEVR